MATFASYLKMVFWNPSGCRVAQLSIYVARAKNEGGGNANCDDYSRIVNPRLHHGFQR